MDARTFGAFLQKWQADGTVTSDGAAVRLTSFKVDLSEHHQALLNRIAALYKQAGFNAPSVSEVSEAVGAPLDSIAAMIRVAQDQSMLIRIIEGLYYHRDTIDEARRIVSGYISSNGSITVSQFRDITGSSRKYALPMMEYFDSIRFTRRLGDSRVLVT
jgi:selenocysteine-specific elongation factor